MPPASQLRCACFRIQCSRLTFRAQGSWFQTAEPPGERPCGCPQLPSGAPLSPPPPLASPVPESLAGQCLRVHAQ
eukprot:1875238-Rhodomonas_salina.2